MTTEVGSISEITRPDVKYISKHDTNVWLEIETLPGGLRYHLNRGIIGIRGLYDFETVGDNVRSWKTLKGVLRFISLQASKGNGFYAPFLSSGEKTIMDEKQAKKTRKNFDVIYRDAKIREENKDKALATFCNNRLEGLELTIKGNVVQFSYGDHEFEVVCLREVESI